MSLSSELISQFVKATKDNKKQPSEATVYGTTVEYNGAIYVKLDGSDLLTPISTTTDTKAGERVTVMIKNHTATVTGNISSPAARTDDVKEIGSKISEFEIVIADKVSAKELEAESARIDSLVADNVTIKGELQANSADISDLKADNVEISGKVTANEADIKKIQTDKLDAEIAEATFATIKRLEATDAKVYNLEGTYGEFADLTAQKFTATEADIKKLQTDKLSAKEAEIKYANIDFTNIGKAAMEYFYAQSGLIKDVTIGDTTITGELVGVTLKGDLIEGNTIKADKLVVKGSDGIYYKLNFEAGTFASGEPVPTDSLHGSVITAKSITAEKVSVKDLVAFGATIGGFHITDKSLYSGVKESVGNTTRGIYLDKDGQVAFGDSSNFLKYYKDTDGTYKLDISAANIRFGASQKSIDDAITEELNNLRVGARNLIRNSVNLIFDNYYFSGTFIAQYDGVSDIAVICGASAIEDGAGNVTLLGSAKASHDGNGNVTIV